MTDPRFIPNPNYRNEAITLHIILVTIRPHLVHSFLESLNKSKAHDFNVTLHVYIHGKALDPYGNERTNLFFDSLTGDLTRQWIYQICDDNLMHPDLLKRMTEEIKKDANARVFLFNQERHDILAPGIKAAPENIRPGAIDVSMAFYRADAVGDIRGVLNKCADGYFLEKIYKQNKDATRFLNETLSYFEAAWWYISGQDKDYGLRSDREIKNI